MHFEVLFPRRPVKHLSRKNERNKQIKQMKLWVKQGEGRRWGGKHDACKCVPYAREREREREREIVSE